MTDVTDKEQQALAGKFKELLATYRQAEDLINIGAYKPGSNPKIDLALSKIERMNAYLKQDISENVSLEDAVEALRKVLE
jgi:flagellum-specific ATP synthase